MIRDSILELVKFFSSNKKIDENEEIKLVFSINYFLYHLFQISSNNAIESYSSIITDSFIPVLFPSTFFLFFSFFLCSSLNLGKHLRSVLH